MEAPASDTAVEWIADAIFKEQPAAVTEAYSAFDRELIEFHSAQDVCAYARSKRGSDGYVHLAVQYSDMAGALTKSLIELYPSKCGGHTYRYQSKGWGLIWVYLKLSPNGGQESFISANSEKRAHAWALTYPAMEPPTAWHWPAVARHLRRLRRALKLAG